MSVQSIVIMALSSFGFRIFVVTAVFQRFIFPANFFSCFLAAGNTDYPCDLVYLWPSAGVCVARCIGCRSHPVKDLSNFFEVSIQTNYFFASYSMQTQRSSFNLYTIFWKKLAARENLLEITMFCHGHIHHDPVLSSKFEDRAMTKRTGLWCTSLNGLFAWSFFIFSVEWSQRELFNKVQYVEILKIGSLDIRRLWCQNFKLHIL